MKTKRVVVETYNSRWSEDFDKIREEILQSLGDLALKIHHVGSTSVPGLAAKPIIDIDVEIASYDVFPLVRERLSNAGYTHEGNLGISGREAFCYENKRHLRKHHLYVCPSDSEELHRHITFRDYLRSHPEAAAQYTSVKLAAADKFPQDIDAYMRYKSDCIAELYQACGLMK